MAINLYRLHAILGFRLTSKRRQSDKILHRQISGTALDIALVFVQIVFNEKGRAEPLTAADVQPSPNSCQKVEISNINDKGPQSVCVVMSRPSSTLRNAQKAKNAVAWSDAIREVGIEA